MNDFKWKMVKEKKKNDGINITKQKAERNEFKKIKKTWKRND